MSRVITIQEPGGNVQPTAQVGSHVASSSRPEVGWQTTFRLANEPLPMIASVRTWAQGEGGKVAQSLVQGLLLLEDMHFFQATLTSHWLHGCSGTLLW